MNLYCVWIKNDEDEWELSYSGRSMTPSVYDSLGSAKRQKSLLTKNGHEVKIMEYVPNKEVI